MTKPIVLDSSAILPLFLRDEPDAYSQGIIGRAPDTRLLSLSFCWLELGNTLTVAVRRCRLSEAQAAFAHHGLSLLPVEFHDYVGSATLAPVHAVAQRRHLSFYDAAYLVFAMEAGAALASLDQALIQAARAEGVTVIEPLAD